MINKTSTYYIAACRTAGIDTASGKTFVEVCDPSIAEFWTVYRRNDDGTSTAISDHTSQSDALNECARRNS